MSTYDPNNRYRPVGEESSGWALGGVIALVVILGVIVWFAWGNGTGGGVNTASNTRATHSETTGMGSPSVPARPMANPPAGVAR